jgi:hypothetical protein
MLINRNSLENEKLTGLKGLSLNPFHWIESGIKERKSKKQKKLLQMKVAMFSGGITRMK